MAVNAVRGDVGKVGQPATHAARTEPEKGAGSFRELLRDSLGTCDKIKFSGHAIDRLSDRGVVMTEAKSERLVRAIEAAEAKGAKDSLVLLDELAFVVSVKNRTVITACETSSLKEGVFTKIDSAVLG